MYSIEEQERKMLLLWENEGGCSFLGEIGLRTLILWKLKYLEVFLSVLMDRNPFEEAQCWILSKFPVRRTPRIDCKRFSLLEE